MSATPPEADQAVFDDSRRLPGPNRWSAAAAVELSALGPAAAPAWQAFAVSHWRQAVRALAAALGWPLGEPLALPHASGLLLAFTAPPDLLLAATDLNEWAWEHATAAVLDAAAGAAGNPDASGSSPASPAGPSSSSLPSHASPAPTPHASSHPSPTTWPAPWQRRHPVWPDARAAAGSFAALAAGQSSPPLARLRAAARQRLASGTPWLEDDDTVSLGAGRHAVVMPRAALPPPWDLPWAQLRGVPTALVSGSNGKTTTVRLLAAMARSAGHVPGWCSTAGVQVGDRPLHQGDYSGPAGARAVLRHADTTLAVLETARGGIARRGLAVARADVAVITNISPDHLGEYGLHTPADIAALKLVLARALPPGGWLVLKGDDPVLQSVWSTTPWAWATQRALFAARHDQPPLQAWRARGGSTCGVHGQGDAAVLRLAHAGAVHDLAPVAEIPLALGGAAAFHLENAAAAALAAVAGLGLPVAAVADTLRRFGQHPGDNAGRLERWRWRGATVLVDYAHNPDGLAQLLAVARALQPRRLFLLLGQAGNRDDEALAELARVAAQARPDATVLKELPAMRRGRQPGEVPARLRDGLLAHGLAADRLHAVDDEAQAAQWLLARAGPGDVVVLPIHTSTVRDALAAQLAAAHPT